MMRVCMIEESNVHVESCVVHSNVKCLFDYATYEGCPGDTPLSQECLTQHACGRFRVSKRGCKDAVKLCV
jgi:hypothetical protein